MRWPSAKDSANDSTSNGRVIIWHEQPGHNPRNGQLIRNAAIPELIAYVVAGITAFDECRPERRVGLGRHLLEVFAISYKPHRQDLVDGIVLCLPD